MNLLFTLLVCLIIFGVVYWVITLLPLPPMLRTIVIVVFAVLVLLVLVDLLTGAVGLGLPR